MENKTLTPLDSITKVFVHLYVQLIFTWKHNVDEI